MMVPLFQETHMLHSDEKISGGICFQISKNYITKGSNTPYLCIMIYFNIFPQPKTLLAKIKEIFLSG